MRVLFILKSIMILLSLEQNSHFGTISEFPLFAILYDKEKVHNIEMLESKKQFYLVRFICLMKSTENVIEKIKSQIKSTYFTPLLIIYLYCEYIRNLKA